LLINVSGLKGIRVLDSFSSFRNGTEPVNYQTQTNSIKLLSGQQAAATVGGGITLRELNQGLRVSGLYSIGAAHGKILVRNDQYSFTNELTSFSFR
jgi:hypothetical protein